VTAGEAGQRQRGGVLFDYGETLVEFTRPAEALAVAEEQIRAVLASAGRTAPSMAAIHAVLERVEVEVVDHQRSGTLEEMDPAAASLRAYRDAGVDLDAGLLDELLRIEQEAWWHGARVDPDAAPLLDSLRERGVRVGLCSNAPYRVRSLHGQLAFLGLDAHLDTVTFSAEVGWRKPAPQIFQTALRALATSVDRTVMVGDSEAADIAGAHASGMRAVLIRRGGGSGPTRADAVIAALRDLPGALRDMGLYWA
jgi:putative hydrolase of the HAD superfamily